MLCESVGCGGGDDECDVVSDRLIVGEMTSECWE